MPDNVLLNPGTGGATIASDEIGGIQYQRVKLTLGADGVNGGDVSASNPMPVTDGRANDIIAGTPYQRVKLVLGNATVDNGNISASNPMPVTDGRAPIAIDPAGRARISQQTTLFDGKIVNEDNTYIWNTAGTGTGTFTGNKYNLAVTSGQFLVRQAKHFTNYFSGKAQFVETSFDTFANQTGVVKRVGYFSSSAVSPYTASLDGFYLESDGVNSTYRLVCVRNGTETLNIPWTSWDNYSLISGYNWNNFTVVAWSFLWLGGAAMQFFIKTNAGFVLAHTFGFAGSASDIFILSPNQPVRYEIRGVSGAGAFRSICSQVSTEGSLEENGFNGHINRLTTSMAANTVGTRYPLIAIRKKVASRNIAVKVTGVSIFVDSADRLLWTLELNPTLSAGLTYSDVDNSPVQQALGNGTITVTTPGRVLAGGYIGQNNIIDPKQFETDYLSYLGVNIDNTLDQIVLVAIPVSATVTTYGSMNYKSY